MVSAKTEKLSLHLYGYKKCKLIVVPNVTCGFLIKILNYIFSIIYIKFSISWNEKKKFNLEWVSNQRWYWFPPIPFVKINIVVFYTFHVIFNRTCLYANAVSSSRITKLYRHQFLQFKFSCKGNIYAFIYTLLKHIVAEWLWYFVPLL